MKNILIADKIADDGIEFLTQNKAFNVTVKTGLNEDELCTAVADQHAVIVRSGAKITAKVLEAGPHMEVIGRAGIGVDNIDIPKATERGVVVLNTPNANATTTAELAIAHLFSLSRNLPKADRSMRDGKWERSAFMGSELAKKKIGVVGYGTIGRLVAERLRGLKMQVFAYDPFVTEEAFAADNVTPLSIDELVSECDYITLHCPVTDKTRNIISRDRIQSMKKTARIINCARGGLIDEAALYDALANGNIAGAALDVYEQEPPTDSPLLTLENIVFSPHLGASTKEAQSAAGTEIADQIATFLTTGEPINAINMPAISGDDLGKLKPYLSLVNRLGRLLAAMIDEPIESLELVACGDVTQFDLRPLTTESLIGLLAESLSAPINRVNAANVATQNGIAVREIRCDEPQDYHALITLTAKHGAETTTVAGTVFDKVLPRLTRINDYEIEAALEGNLLLTRHQDQPGVIAAISQILAERKINISRMQLGIVPNSDKAVAVLGIESALEEDAMQALHDLDVITKTLQISL